MDCTYVPVDWGAGAGTFYAGSQPSEADIAVLINDLKITIFVNLRRELQYNHVLEKAGFYKLPDCAYIQYPITDGEAPTIPQARILCIAIEEWLHQGHNIYLHCHMGCGRAPTMAAAYLMKNDGLNADAALNRLRDAGICGGAGHFVDVLRPQRDFLYRWQNLFPKGR